ncbi:MAG: DMT family transporter [Atopobiaceae bacterium]|nr:DMT family transporter [Atopobiaceae bacterium]
MNNDKTIPSWVYKLLILGAALIWGLSFVVMKGALDVMAPAWLLGIRFALTALILALVWRKPLVKHLNVSHLGLGLVLGLAEGTGYLFQNYGLVETTPGRNAFLTATYCVMVPFMWWIVARRKPRPLQLAAAVVCVIGVGLLSLADGESLLFALGTGDVLSLVSAVFFGIHIVIVSSVGKAYDIATLTVLQMLGISALCFFWAVVSGVPFDMPQLNMDFVVQMGYLVIFASCIAMGIQNIAQQHMSAPQASLLLSTESVFGVFFGVVLYGEPLTLRLVGGFALIFIAIVMSELAPELKGLGRQASRELP